MNFSGDGVVLFLKGGQFGPSIQCAVPLWFEVTYVYIDRICVFLMTYSNTATFNDELRVN